MIVILGVFGCHSATAGTFLLPDVSVFPTFGAYRPGSTLSDSDFLSSSGLTPQELAILQMGGFLANATEIGDASQSNFFAAGQSTQLLTVIGEPADRIALGTGTVAPSNPNWPAQFVVHANIDGSGNVQSGKFNLQGTTEVNPPNPVSSPSVSLLNGTITDLRLTNAFDSIGYFELVAQVSQDQDLSGDFLGGELAQLFGPEIVIRINVAGAVGNFFNGFAIGMGSAANVGRPVPEPAAATAWCAMLGFTMLRRHRRRCG